MRDATSHKKWLPDVISAYQAAGGTARFPQVYRWIQGNRTNLPSEWEAAVRATVYHYSSNSPVFRKGDPDVFYKQGHGLWGLRRPSEKLIGKAPNDLFVQVLSTMTKEQFEACAVRGEEPYTYIMRRVEEEKKKYKIG